MTLLDTNEENVLELLMQLPNRELVLQASDGVQQIPSTCSSTSKLVIDSSSTLSKKKPSGTSQKQPLVHKKSLFHT